MSMFRCSSRKYVSGVDRKCSGNLTISPMCSVPRYGSVSVMESRIKEKDMSSLDDTNQVDGGNGSLAALQSRRSEK